MRPQISLRYDILETLERAYEALLRSSPDPELLGYETKEDAKNFHSIALRSLMAKIIEYRKLG